MPLNNKLLVCPHPTKHDSEHLAVHTWFLESLAAHTNSSKSHAQFRNLQIYPGRLCFLPSFMSTSGKQEIEIKVGEELYKAIEEKRPRDYMEHIRRYTLPVYFEEAGRTVQKINSLKEALDLQCSIDEIFQSGLAGLGASEQCQWIKGLVLYLKKDDDKSNCVPDIGVCVECGRLYHKCCACHCLNVSYARFCTSCGREINFQQLYKTYINFCCPRLPNIKFVEVVPPHHTVVDVPGNSETAKIAPRIRLCMIGERAVITFPFGRVLILQPFQRILGNQLLDGFSANSWDPQQDDRLVYAPVWGRVRNSHQYPSCADMIFLASKKRVYSLRMSLPGSLFEEFYCLDEGRRILQAPLLSREYLHLFIYNEREAKIQIWRLRITERNMEPLDGEFDGFISSPLPMNNGYYIFYDASHVYLIRINSDEFKIVAQQEHGGKFTKELRMYTGLAYTDREILQLGHEHLYKIRRVNKNNLAVYRVHPIPAHARLAVYPSGQQVLVACDHQFYKFECQPELTLVMSRDIWDGDVQIVSTLQVMGQQVFMIEKREHFYWLTTRASQDLSIIAEKRIGKARDLCVFYNNVILVEEDSETRRFISRLYELD